ncbi:MAG TPA: hypothetical protein PLB59_07990 [Bacteroidales bacterium]|nr:hypothetical protein [Paludibacteraceae bacterium]HPB25620.1 hypothetical protein [Bacteroidales bacterium]HQN17423.1 hypothetical protein [Bacteroidales bacterium]HQP15894.1 hypothetical protein [Bacteroidales bacterium]
MKNSIKDIFQYILGALVVIGFFVLMIVLTFKGIPSENKETFTLVVGALLTAFSIVVGYFYGSSLGSSKKNDLINKKEE